MCGDVIPNSYGNKINDRVERFRGRAAGFHVLCERLDQRQAQPLQRDSGAFGRTQDSERVCP